jgi:hypothetical protein
MKLKKMELEFKDKTVKVTSLYQWSTYEGLIEGLPTDKMNERILNSIHEKATVLTHIENFLLIKPKQTPIDIKKKYPFGEPMSLPGITCIVGLKYHGTSNPNVGGISELTLIWDQKQKLCVYKIQA